MKNRFTVGATVAVLAVGVTAPAALAQTEDGSVDAPNDAIDVEETLDGNELLGGNETLNDTTVEAANSTTVEATDVDEAEASDVVDVQDTLDEVLGL